MPRTFFSIFFFFFFLSLSLSLSSISLLLPCGCVAASPKNTVALKRVVTVIVISVCAVGFGVRVRRYGAEDLTTITRALAYCVGWLSPHSVGGCTSSVSPASVRTSKTFLGGASYVD